MPMPISFLELLCQYNPTTISYIFSKSCDADKKLIIIYPLEKLLLFRSSLLCRSIL